MKRDEFEAKVGEHIDAIIECVVDQDNALFTAVENAETYRAHMSAIGERYCDVCMGIGKAEEAPVGLGFGSYAYALELHMGLAHDNRWNPHDQPHPCYTADQWRLMASLLAARTSFKVVEVTGDVDITNPDYRDHLNDGHVSYGDVLDEEGHVALSVEKQVAMFKSLLEDRG